MKDFTYNGWSYIDSPKIEKDDCLYFVSEKNNIFAKHKWLFQVTYGVMLVTMISIFFTAVVNFLHYYLFINPFIALIGVLFFFLTALKMFPKASIRLSDSLVEVLIPLKVERICLSDEDDLKKMVNDFKIVVESGKQEDIDRVMKAFERGGLREVTR